MKTLRSSPEGRAESFPINSSHIKYAGFSDKTADLFRP